MRPYRKQQHAVINCCMRPHRYLKSLLWHTRKPGHITSAAGTIETACCQPLTENRECSPKTHPEYWRSHSCNGKTLKMTTFCNNFAWKYRTAKRFQPSGRPNSNNKGQQAKTVKNLINISMSISYNIKNTMLRNMKSISSDSERQQTITIASRYWHIKPKHGIAF